MQGFDVWDQPGYDTHGLPIENKVEKKLGFKSKQDIEKFGIKRFNDECRKFATEFLDIMSKQFENLGVWMNWNRPYLTLTNEYIEGAWYTFKVAFEKGFLYKDVYSVHVCPHCETVVAYNEIVYAKLTETSVYIKFPVKGKKNEFLLIWTTTPWTLPSNTGIMVKPSANYAYVKVGDETLIIAEPLVENVMEKASIDDYEVVKLVKGEDLNGVEYVHPLSDLFPFHKKLKNAWRVVLSEQYVTLDEGTGLVHTAPGHGEEDYKVAKETGLPIVSPLNMNGTYNKECGKFSGMFAKDADPIIIDEFRKRGLLFAQEDVTHDYPLCWRCKSPLLFMAVPQWFFKVTRIRDKLLEENSKVNWIPEWAGKRMENWLKSLGDWPVSRQRYWGIPLPIWVCEKCGKIKVIGSRKELPKVPEDLHRPYIDEIKLNCECGGTMKRIPDVLDVWFDSGLASWASLGYPNKKDLFAKLWPSDFQTEGPDQIRGWWNSQLITSVITFGKAPYKNILFHGFILDAHGNKMSKSLGNIIAPEDVMKKYGRDVFRFYLLSSPAWNDFYFNWDDAENINRMFNILRNVFQFVKTYVSKVPKEKPELNIEDRWIISRVNSLILVCENNFKHFHHHRAAEAISDFILKDFSRWYIKLVRDRTWPLYEGKDKYAAFYTLINVTENLIKLLAPMCPFIAEDAYQTVIKPLKGGLESIHLYNYPEAKKTLIDEELEESMNIVRDVFEASSAARQCVGIRLRWPLRALLIVTKDKKVENAVKRLKPVLMKMCNVKHVEVRSKEPSGKFSTGEFDGGKVFLDLTEDKNLMEERLYRELVRKIQAMRKEHKFVVSEKIGLTLASDHETEESLKKYVDALKRSVGATSVTLGRLEGKYEGNLMFMDKKIRIKFEKVE